jgi:hypothetical protein
VLLIAERAALLTGRDDEFTLLVTIAYTGPFSTGHPLRRKPVSAFAQLKG